MCVADNQMREPLLLIFDFTDDVNAINDKNLP